MARNFPRVKLPEHAAGEAPTPRRRSARYDWDDVRKRMEDHPGLWILADADVSTGMFTFVSRGRPAAFYGMGGHLECTMRDQKFREGTRTLAGELWVRWEPEGWTEEDQARAEALAEAGEGAL